MLLSGRLFRLIGWWPMTNFHWAVDLASWLSSSSKFSCQDCCRIPPAGTHKDFSLQVMQNFAYDPLSAGHVTVITVKCTDRCTHAAACLGLQTAVLSQRTCNSCAKSTQRHMPLPSQQCEVAHEQQRLACRSKTRACAYCTAVPKLCRLYKGTKTWIDLTGGKTTQIIVHSDSCAQNQRNQCKVVGMHMQAAHQCYLQIQLSDTR